MSASMLIKRVMLAGVFFLFTLPFCYADDPRVTPYGGYCRECTIYGVCKEPIPPKESIHALRNYYNSRGFDIGAIQHRGRFIEAEIFRDNKPVDRIIFDRKTGRVRSVY
jgi:hypothetical protein